MPKLRKQTFETAIIERYRRGDTTFSVKSRADNKAAKSLAGSV